MTTTAPVHIFSEDDFRAAERRWRAWSSEALSPVDLAGEIEYWARHRELLLGDLSAEDFASVDESAVRGGIAYAEHRLADLTRQATRYERLNSTPPGVSGPREDLRPRFAAAKYADLVDIAQTFTGQTASKSGNGRFRLRCPFHNDRHPSLILYPPGKGWWCPVCAKGGSDAVSFVAELRRCTALEALLLVELIADTCPTVWGAA